MRRRAVQAPAETVAVLVTAFIVAGMGVYVNRRDVAQGLAETWLRDQGIPGVLSIERLDADGFSGRLRIGPEADPDLSVDRVEVDLALDPAWADRPFKLSARAIRLVRPRLKARLDARGLTFGRLDPVVQDFLARPPDENAVGPVVLIEDGDLRLATDYGDVRLGGSGAVDDGRLVRFDGRVLPASLRSAGFSATLGESAVRLAGAGDRITGWAALDVQTLTAPGLRAQNADVTLSLDAPYPDGTGAQLAGPLLLDADLRGDTVGVGGRIARAVRADLSLNGRSAGPLTAPRFTGRAELTAAADRVDGVGLTARALNLRAGATRLELARTPAGAQLALAGAADATAASVRAGQGELRRATLRLRTSGMQADIGGGPPRGPVTASLRSAEGRWDDIVVNDLTTEATTDLALSGGTVPLAVNARADRLTLPVDGRAASLRDVALRFSGPASARAAGFAWTAAGSAAAAGGFDPATAAQVAGRIPVLSGADSHGDDLRRALADFTLQAPQLSLALGPRSTTLASIAAVRMHARSGARLALTGRPLLSLAGGAASGDVNLAAEGGGLPDVTLALADWRASPAGFSSPVRFTARELDAAIARDATVSGAGRASLSGGRFTFDAAGCIPVTAAEIEFGENDLAGAAAEVCPVPGAPLVGTDANGYRVQGAFRRAGLDWPVSQVRAAAAEGRFDVRGGEAGLTAAAVRLGAATVTDTAPVKRYEPIRLAGGIDLAGGVWRGRFDAGTPAGQRLGAVDVTHADGVGAGSTVIDARGITFAEDGLQPGDLTPLIAGISTGANGAIDFTGRVDWTKAGSTSSGRLRTQGLNFTSPAGQLSAVDADIALTSLTPLISAPDQRVTVRSIGALTDITDLVTVFTLLEDEVRVASTEFAMAGGRVRFEPLVIPLTENATYTGVMVIDDVQLGTLIEAVNLGKSLALDAVVDGRIPFEIGPGRVRFADGSLTAVRPGRISIKRESLTGVSASGEATAAAPGAPVAEAAPVNAIQDFAYQAMENLAFQHLDVGVNSLSEGRLGLLFKIQGEHDPVVAEEARVGILDAILGRAFDRRIPLPDGTPVNLTLDTTLNFDELLQAWLEIGRRRAAAADGNQP